jgi:hypothetical protein
MVKDAAYEGHRNLINGARIDETRVGLLEIVGRSSSDLHAGQVYKILLHLSFLSSYRGGPHLHILGM